MVNRFLRAFASALLAFSVLLVAYGVARNIALAWVLGCISLGFAVQLIIDCAYRS